ncbi:MAG TPA: DUF4159 domain-containing protein [Bacteroidetes bacterium]|nr:DUF4159 domain-containing protein [Bacteroidota bacterium]
MIFSKRHLSLMLCGVSLLLAVQAPAQSKTRYLNLKDTFTFVRIKWLPKRDVYGIPYYQHPVPPWAHDYPVAERNMYQIIDYFTDINSTGEPLVLTLKDEDIYDFPIIYICEIGVWEPDEDETKRLREYLQRGGFMIVDDFRSRPELANFISQMKKIVPEYTYRKLDERHPLFNCYFQIKKLPRMSSPYVRDGYLPVYYGWFDPEGRMAAIVNYNNDVGDGWEWPDDLTSFSREAFQLGINYIIYSMTH